MHVAKMRERSHRASARRSNRRTRGFVSMFAAIPSQLRSR
jgi:hypothetical protein